MTVKDICALFDIGGTYLRCNEIVSGNINSTFKVSFVRDGVIKEYILQKINKDCYPCKRDKYGLRGVLGK